MISQLTSELIILKFFFWNEFIKGTPSDEKKIIYWLYFLNVLLASFIYHSILRIYLKGGDKYKLETDDILFYQQLLRGASFCWHLRKKSFSNYNLVMLFLFLNKAAAETWLNRPYLPAAIVTNPDVWSCICIDPKHRGSFSMTKNK